MAKKPLNQIAISGQNGQGKADMFLSLGKYNTKKYKSFASCLKSLIEISTIDRFDATVHWHLSSPDDVETLLSRPELKMTQNAFFVSFFGVFFFF